MSRSRWFTFLFALICAAGAAPQRAAALEREFVLRWLPSSGTVTGYRAYLAPQGQQTQILDLGAVTPDPDGVARAAIQLDAALAYAVSMTAYNTAGESSRSNQITVPASSCDPAACDDGDPCTADDCQDLNCIHAPLPDGSVCSGGAVCISGTCAVPDCVSHADCDDGNRCNGTETCVGFACVAGASLTCAQPGPCQQGGCSSSSGCWLTNLANGTSCSDGNPDTTGDQCVSGKCVGTLFTGCRSDAECSDGNLCNGAETCGTDGSCLPGTALVCGGSTQCAEASCSPQGGCVMSPRPNGTTCNDGDALTTGDQCVSGLCAGTFSGCSSDSECNDGNLCNGAETCGADGACRAGTALVCGGSTQCVDAQCSASSGCVTAPRPDGTKCDDGVSTTGGDQCVAGLCQGTAIEPLDLTSISPNVVVDARYYNLQLSGSGFMKGMKVSFASRSMSNPPLVRRMRILGSRSAEARIWVQRRSLAETWDVVVTLPDGRTATLPGALRTDP